MRKIIGLVLGLFAAAALIERQWFVGAFLLLLAWVLLRKSGADGSGGRDDVDWSDSRSDRDGHHVQSDAGDPHRDDCGPARADDRDDHDRNDDTCDIGDDGGGSGGGDD
ncbi:MAG: hypothetical protein E6Q88_10850 [Lysobacteraceae bacterium]|nr:MAG: hypothetical protein E6Q88_10850 [Xanthomonadaceae bacterium]